MNKCDCYQRCRCAKPVVSVEDVPDSLAMLKYNFDGVATFYDHEDMILRTQTDTSLSADSIQRVLTYMAERHIDSISAKELGSILHLSDLGDVEGTNIDHNSMLVYKKDTDCSQGCEGINNSWKAWNALNTQATSLKTVMGFDEEGAPYALQAPANANQYYNLGWNGNGKVSYSQPQDVTIASITDSSQKVSILALDPSTKQVVSIKVLASKLQELTEA